MQAIIKKTNEKIDVRIVADNDGNIRYYLETNNGATPRIFLENELHFPGVQPRLTKKKHKIRVDLNPRGNDETVRSIILSPKEYDRLLSIEKKYNEITKIINK